jgi:hypothetical protein
MLYSVQCTVVTRLKGNSYEKLREIIKGIVSRDGLSTETIGV